MEYKVISFTARPTLGWEHGLEGTLERLELLVKQQLENGWRPTGGVSVIEHPEGYTAVQAVVKD